MSTSAYPPKDRFPRAGGSSDCAKKGVENDGEVVLAHVAVTGQGPLHPQPTTRGDPLDDARDERAVAGDWIDPIVVCVGHLVGHPFMNFGYDVVDSDTGQGMGEDIRAGKAAVSGGPTWLVSR